MKRLLGAALATALLFALAAPARADDKGAKAILDKAIQALGGEAKLSKLQAFTWKTTGTVTFGGNDNEYTGQTTAQGLDRMNPVTMRRLRLEYAENPDPAAQEVARWLAGEYLVGSECLTD